MYRRMVADAEPVPESLQAKKSNLNVPTQNATHASRA
jgi:hypothetical protein